MSKESMLKRAFYQAMVNDAIRHTDEEADFLVVKNYMTRYAQKHGIDVSSEEIEQYIVQQHQQWKDLLKDFFFQNEIEK